MPVQLSRPSVGQYVLGPLLIHDTRCRWHCIDNPGCVKWRETLPSQEESAGRDIPMKQFVTKVLVSRESPLPPCQLCPGPEENTKFVEARERREDSTYEKK